MLSYVDIVLFIIFNRATYGNEKIKIESMINKIYF